MINQESHDLYDLNQALKVENLTLNDYEEICKRLKRKPNSCLLYTSPSPRDRTRSRMPSSA